MLPRLSTSMLARAALAAALLTAVVAFYGQLAFGLRPALAVASQWADPEAQYRLSLGAVPYDLLRAAQEVLPPDVSVLLITPGRDVRHLEYSTFHRALYFLTPRPVWWLAPVPSDGTWEARWWISAPLTASAIGDVAAEKGAACLLAFGVSPPGAAGVRVATWEQGALFQLDENVPCTQTASGETIVPTRASLAWPLRLLGAVGIALLLGHQVTAVVARMGYRAEGVEAAALAWILGSGVLTVGMLWLNALDVSLKGQRAVLSAVVIGLWGWSIVQRSTPSRTGGDRPTLRSCQAARRTAHRQDPTSHSRMHAVQWLLAAVLMSLVILQVAYVALLAVGGPLAVWDSWVNWGMKARTIFVEGRISPAVYADPSRAVTLLDYPLHVPLVQAWLYAWLDAPDDRLAGTPVVLSYLALAGICLGAVRLRGGSQTYALGAMAVVLSMRFMAELAAHVFPDVLLAVLATATGIYLVKWLDGEPLGTLVIAALSAGLLPWTKREGLLLLACICITAVAIGRQRPRRAWLGVACLALAGLFLAGPWWAFLAWKGVANDAFLSLSASNLWANLGRVPFIGWSLVTSLASPNWSFVWPLVGLLAGWQFIRRKVRAAVAKSHEALLLAAPIIYLGTVGAVYVFSAFVPYQQHVVSSAYRLIAHVAPLAALWLVYQGLQRL